MNKIEQKIKNIISNKFNITHDKLILIKSFKKELNIDSLDIIEIIMDIEDEFNIVIPDEYVDKLDNFYEIKNYLNKILNK
ncbi:acyl carrier protein [endosymbiont of Euscepes postfasciatus]|uniref:phosphopantetheine-binding protein n=1 Tax=endosymbiont of Euscepes postfasciatus TaxID=650377 RepID=UPI000DC7128F|nr:phosphopantetheine-binding protein [endosymbiont of Euscepes postfasciatus]BBA84635.1 acyl carrier protein [endosymbiont of Euscepes postfasciatus]